MRDEPNLWQRQRLPTRFAVLPRDTHTPLAKGVTIAAGSGAVISGRVVIKGKIAGMKAAPSPRLARVWVRRDLESGGSPVVVQRSAATIAEDGTFRIENVPEGPMRFEAAMTTDAYYLEAVRQNGRDLTDEALDVGRGVRMDDVEVVIAVNASQVSGRVVMTPGMARPEVVVFPAGMETPRGRERLTRVGQVNESGQFTIRGLAPGEYRVAAVRGAREGIVGDAKFQAALQPAAKRVKLGAGKGGVGVLEAVDAPR